MIGPSRQRTSTARERRRVQPAAEHGAAGLTLVLAAALFFGVGLGAVATIGDLALAAARARAAADAAALAAAGTSPLVAARPVTGAVAPGSATTTQSPKAAAEVIAAANGAKLVAVDGRGWPLRYGVTVTVAPALGWVRALTGPQPARSVAAVRPIRGSDRPPRV